MFGRTRCVLWMTGNILLALLMAVELGFGEKTGGSDDDSEKKPSADGKNVFQSSKCPEDDSECKELCSGKDQGVGSCEDEGQNCKCTKIQGRFWHGKQYKPSAPRDCYMCG